MKGKTQKITREQAVEMFSACNTIVGPENVKDIDIDISYALARNINNLKPLKKEFDDAVEAARKAYVTMKNGRAVKDDEGNIVFKDHEKFKQRLEEIRDEEVEFTPYIIKLRTFKEGVEHVNPRVLSPLLDVIVIE